MTDLTPEQACSAISIETFNGLLSSYRDIVPEKLHELDIGRYVTIPTALKVESRGLQAQLSKAQVQTLVDWKLSHGTFRPSLKKLVSQNAEDDVREITLSAFAIWMEPEKNVKACITTLSKLRGIGPATASLLLSVYDPDAVPFFSDEIFRWALWEDGPGKGWDRKIGYTVKEYLELYRVVTEMRRRIKEESGKDGNATDAEKVAYVLGNRASSTAAEKEYDDAVKGMFESSDARRDAEMPVGDKKRKAIQIEENGKGAKVDGQEESKVKATSRASKAGESDATGEPRRSKRNK